MEHSADSGRFNARISFAELRNLLTEELAISLITHIPSCDKCRRPAKPAMKYEEVTLCVTCDLKFAEIGRRPRLTMKDMTSGTRWMFRLQTR